MQEGTPSPASVSGLTPSPCLPTAWTNKVSEAVPLVVSPPDSPCLDTGGDVFGALAWPCASLAAACRGVKCLGGVGSITGVEVPLLGEQRSAALSP